MLFDMGGIAGSMLLCLLSLISLTDANSSPVINQNLYRVCEDIPVGVVAFTIDATDPEDAPLTFRLTGSNAGYFTVNAASGIVSVQRELDRENNDVMSLGVTVSDGPNQVDGNLNIILLDANDNKPIFQESSYDINIPENTAVGSSLFKVHATDEDSSNAGVVQYRIAKVTPEAGTGLFSIVATTGEVRLSGSLNYTSLSTFYRLNITASDGGGQCHSPEPNYHSSTAFSFITVVDVPDLDPQFIGVPYVGRVEENSVVGKSVLTVTAIDQDLGINDKLIYSIQDSTPDGLFTISSDTGIISVSAAINRETIGDTVTLTVKATESKENIHAVFASTTTTVLINIIDLNDESPQFYKCGKVSCENANQFTGEVFEHSLGSIPFNMTVKDLDKFSNTKLTLEGANKDVFSVEPQLTSSDSIVQFLVKQPQKLDYETTTQMVLQVIATDEEEPTFKSTATVTINIKDTNDNSPKFEQDTYKLKVAEHSVAGTIIAKITAEDPDSMDKDNITYKLLPESILVYFDVEPRTGSIYVTNADLLDREVRSLYSATLQARDTDGKPGSTVLEITVTDINDQHPVMNRDSYLVFVKEGEELELKIEATDADDSDTANSQIVYAILPSRYSDNFTIDSKTGVLRNRGELDREAMDPKLKGRIELNVTATDKGTPPLSTTATVIINVEDKNDNIPQFATSSYTFSVKEGEKGAFVGSVYAVDLDQTTDFNRISFSIIDGSFGSFIIRSFADERGYRGNISVDPDIELDYESNRKQFNLRVEAADLEQNKAVVMVEVNVLDVNDERPEFKPIPPVTVKENTTITEAVGSFTGFDKDGNHSLIYELESMKCRCNGSLIPCNSFILDPTGEVRVNPINTLDYEQCDLVLIEAEVVDKFTEKGENNSVTTGEMVINIEDINDNAPEFIYSDSVFVVVSESANKGTSVAGVTAIDRDSGINRQIEFKVTAVQFKDTNNRTTTMRILFEAVTTQQKDIYVGIIQTTEGLDMTLKGKYLVTVTATDTGDLSTSTLLDIFTVDETYKVELEFTSSEAEVEKNLNEIIRALTAATKTAVEIVAIRPGTSESRDTGSTIIVAYFVYTNGTALTSVQVDTMLSDPEHFLVLGQLGLKNIGKAPVKEPDTDPVKYILLGIVGGLVIVLGVLITSLMCTRRTYGRKLKAAKAMNSASMMTSDNQKGGAVVPGTNKYTMEGANPVLNLNIDTAMILGLDEESSDVDKVSLNSLDYSDDMSSDDKDTKPIMMIKEEDEEDNGPPEYIEPLGAALAQRGEKKSTVNPLMGYDNPEFSTTDL
ncbi:cadherin-related family member 2 isoform X2 [Dicentrarchus labrax]|uniref:cadherin-related family member 2 isoform X2 n=1 Tax=Dicentrarchus labrax TaxID=13489 RepID=UPI0021F5E234|nr:cadherin-related family member 2 isoform X2 [Dicentrarchus labrax]